MTYTSREESAADATAAKRATVEMENFILNLKFAIDEEFAIDVGSFHKSCWTCRLILYLLAAPKHYFPNDLKRQRHNEIHSPPMISG